MTFLRRISLSLFLAGGMGLGITTHAFGQTAESLTLQQAVADGIAHHPRVEAAAAALMRSKALVSQARAGELPSIAASEDAILSNDPVFAFGTKLRQGRFAASDFDLQNLNHPSPIGNFALSATATWLAFDLGSTRKRVQSAVSNSKASELARQYTQEEVANLVTRLFYRALLAQAQLSVAETNLKRTEEVAADIHDRVRSGLSLDSDGMRADISVRNAQDDLSSTQDNVRVARRDLFEAIGQPLTDQPLAAPVADNSTALKEEAQPDTSLASRLDMQSLDMQQKAAQQRLSSIRASAGPQLSTYGRVEANNPHFTSGGSSNWTVGAKLEIRVFDGGTRRAQEQEAKAQIQSLASQKELTLQNAHSAIAALQAQIDDLQRRYHTAELSIQANREALQTARDRYAAGLVAVSEVLNGEADLSAAQFTRVRTFYQLRIAISDLQFAAGSSSSSKAGHS